MKARGGQCRGLNYAVAPFGLEVLLLGVLMWLWLWLWLCVCVCVSVAEEVEGLLSTFSDVHGMHQA